MIGIRHEKIADLKTIKFQLTHDLAVAHKYKNKMPFNELAVNTTFNFDKSGNIKETKFYRFKYETDYKYAKLFLKKGQILTISDVHPVDKLLTADKRTDLINKLNYLNNIFTKQDINILKNSIELFDNTEKLAKWYIQQSKNKKQSFKKTTGKSIHKSLKPFMRTVIFTGDKDDIQKVNSMCENDYNQTIINYMQKLQQKYGIQRDSITITTHNDEIARHTHIIWHNWSDSDKKYLNNDMNSPDVMREHLDLLETEFSKFDLKKRTEYTKESRKKHKTYAEHLAETELKTQSVSRKLATLRNEYNSQLEINADAQLKLDEAKTIRVIEETKISTQINMRYKHIETVADKLTEQATSKTKNLLTQIENDNNIVISPENKQKYLNQTQISKSEMISLFSQIITGFKAAFEKIESLLAKKNNKSQLSHKFSDIFR